MNYFLVFFIAQYGWQILSNPHVTNHTNNTKTAFLQTSQRLQFSAFIPWDKLKAWKQRLNNNTGIISRLKRSCEFKECGVSMKLKPLWVNRVCMLMLLLWSLCVTLCGHWDVNTKDEGAFTNNKSKSAIKHKIMLCPNLFSFLSPGPLLIHSCRRILFHKHLIDKSISRLTVDIGSVAHLAFLRCSTCATPQSPPRSAARRRAQSDGDSGKSRSSAAKPSRRVWKWAAVELRTQTADRVFPTDTCNIGCPRGSRATGPEAPASNGRVSSVSLSPTEFIWCDLSRNSS